MKVTFVADSTLGLAPERAAGLGIHVVPARVRVGELDLADYLEIRPGEVVRAFTRGIPLGTSAPSPSTFAETFEVLLGSHDRVVAVTASKYLSAIHQSAVLAAESFGDRVLVLDSLALSAGLRFVIEAVRRWLAEGLPFEKIAPRAEAYAAGIVGWILPRSLEALRRSGRIRGLAHAAGRALGVLPILELRDGRLRAVGRVRGFGRGLDELVRRYRPFAPRRVALAHVEDPETAERLARALSAVGAKVDPRTHDAGAAVAVHGGPGTVGILVDPGDA